jgi:hypothetical protein
VFARITSGAMQRWLNLKHGRMEGWKDGRMEGWKDGRMEGWKDGRMERMEEEDAIIHKRGLRAHYYY